jgi:hypothetical protein
VTAVAERVVPAEVLAGLAGRLAALRWPCPAAEAGAVLTGLGWTVDSVSEFGAVARTGLPFGQGNAYLQVDGDHTVDLTLEVSDEFGPEADELLALRDAFARAAAAVGRALGEPTGRRPGGSPEVRWRGDSSTVLLGTPAGAVQLQLASNDYLDDMDEAEERGL